MNEFKKGLKVNNKNKTKKNNHNKSNRSKAKRALKRKISLFLAGIFTVSAGGITAKEIDAYRTNRDFKTAMEIMRNYEDNNPTAYQIQGENVREALYLGERILSKHDEAENEQLNKAISELGHKIAIKELLVEVNGEEFRKDFGIAKDICINGEGKIEVQVNDNGEEDVIVFTVQGTEGGFDGIEKKQPAQVNKTLREWLNPDEEKGKPPTTTGLKKNLMESMANIASGRVTYKPSEKRGEQGTFIGEEGNPSKMIEKYKEKQEQEKLKELLARYGEDYDLR